MNCDEITKKLSEFDRELQKDPAYGIDRHKKPPSRSSTLESVLTNGDSSSDFKGQIIQTHKLDHIKPTGKISLLNTSSDSLVPVREPRSRPTSPSLNKAKVRFSQDLSSVQESPDIQRSQELEQRPERPRIITEAEEQPVVDYLDVPRDEQETSSGCSTLNGSSPDTGHNGNSNPIDQSYKQDADVSPTRNGTRAVKKRDETRLIPQQGNFQSDNGNRGRQMRSVIRKLFCFT